MHEPVNASEKMGATIDCGKRTNQVYMDVGKPRVRWAKMSNWRHGVYMHFELLAGQAGTNPLVYVSILGGHQALFGTNSRMLKTMELCAELTSYLFGYIRTRTPCSHVTVVGMTTDCSTREVPLTAVVIF